MLKGIDPRVTPDLLDVLARMGHGDTIAIVDSNYPAYSAGPRVLTEHGLDAPTAIGLVLGLIPLDTFVDHPIRYMEGAPGEELRPVTREVLEVAARAECHEVSGRPMERFAFYEAARSARAVIHTQETRPYGCYLLTKGVLPVFGPEPGTQR